MKKNAIAGSRPQQKNAKKKITPATAGGTEHAPPEQAGGNLSPTAKTPKILHKNQKSNEISSKRLKINPKNYV